MILGTTFCTYESAFTPEECDKIIELSRDKMKRSTVINKSTNDISDVRTSSNTFLTDSVDPLLKNYPVRIREVTVGVILSISFF